MMTTTTTTPVPGRRRVKILLLAGLALLALALAAVADWRTPGGLITSAAVERPPLPDPAVLWPRLATLTDSPVHILLLGVDRRKNEQCRSDAIAVLRCEQDTISLISVPRDSVVFFGGSSSPQKINAAYAFGGAAMAKREIGKLLGIGVDGCVVVDFVTFVQVAKAVKTVTLDGKLIGAEELLRNIDGLLTWLRSRSSADGDNDRMKKHQIFITHGFAYMLKLWHDHPDIYQTLLTTTLSLLETDITAQQVQALTVQYREVAQAQMERFIMPGVPAWIDFNTGIEVPYEEAMRVLHGTEPPADAAAAQVKTDAALDAVEVMEEQRFQQDLAATGDGYLIDSDSAAQANVPAAMILSYFRIEPAMTVPKLLAQHRARGENSNYRYDPKLDITVIRHTAAR